jgi:hypothetical protein
MSKTNHPAEKITWRKVKSKNTAEVGWDRERRLYVKFRDSSIYFFYPNHSSVKIA